MWKSCLSIHLNFIKCTKVEPALLEVALASDFIAVLGLETRHPPLDCSMEQYDDRQLPLHNIIEKMCYKQMVHDDREQ